MLHSVAWQQIHHLCASQVDVGRELLLVTAGACAYNCMGAVGFEGLT